ncbi:MAG TPA: PspC domain-containing protein [Solirubrobacterales bacterium]|nr:PspC domain-containing protein [Solirubrobacterales bacterium]
MNEEEKDAQTESAPKRLLRSDDDRMLAGVAGGLADYFGLDPIIFRIAFGVSVLFGGLGLVVYLALTLFVPLDDGSEHPQAIAQRSNWTALLAIGFLLLIAIPAIGGGLIWGDGPGSLFWIAVPIAAAVAAWAVVRDRGGWRGGGKTLGAVLLALLAATVFASLALTAALLTAVGEGVAVAVGLSIAGVLLIALAVLGLGRWLILPVAAIALGASAAAASDFDLEGGIGERTYQPAGFSEIPADGYQLGIGELVIDLRDIEWAGRTLELDARLGMGEAVIAVPERVCVTGDAEARVGEMAVAGQRLEGVDLELPDRAAPKAGPALELDASLDVGALRVVNDDAVDVLRERGGGANSLDDNVLRERNTEACSR